MAFPQVAAVNGGSTDDVSNHTVNLPANIDAGDLLLAFFAADLSPVITFPGGWTEIFQRSGGGHVKFGAWYRIADGGEGATIIVTTSSSERAAYTTYRITGYSDTPEGDDTNGASGTPDPPNLGPTWGAEDTLWFACCGNDGNRSVSAYPANYTDGRNDRRPHVAGCGVGTARRERNIAAENPATFTISAADQWVAGTVAVRSIWWTTYYKSPSGSVALSGELTRTIFKALAGTITPAGAVTTIRTRFRSLSGTITPTGAISKARTYARALAGTITPAGAMTNLVTYVRSFGGTITPAGAIGRTIYKALAGTITPAGALVKMTSKSLAGTLDLAGVIAKLWIPLKFGYTLEVHNSAGDLISVLKNSMGIRYIRTLNQPHQLLFQLPADDDALDDITLPNEIWLRSSREGTVIRKFKLIRETDRRT